MPPRNSSAAFLKEGLFTSKLIKPKRLSYGDTIGIVSPSLISKEESMEPILERIAELGFKIKRGKNLYSATNTFAGSVEERAEDFNAMLADPEVDMLLFGGGALRPPMTSLINGSGNFKLNLAVALLDGVFMRICLSMLLGLAVGYGVYGFWYGHALAGFTPFVIGGVYFLSGNWRTRKYIIGKNQLKK